MPRVSSKTFLSATLIVAIIGVTILRRPNFAHADTYNLYASNCTGGWENPSHAVGTPDVLGPQVAQFTEYNSAVLRDGQTAQINCGDFRGDVSVNTAPKRVFAKFSWAATYPSEVRAIEEERARMILSNGSSTPVDQASTTAPSGGGGNSETSASTLIQEGTATTSTDVATSSIATSTATDTPSVTIPQETATSSTESTSTAPVPIVTSPPAAQTEVDQPEAPVVTPTPPASQPEASPATDGAPSAAVSFFEFLVHSAFAEEVLTISTPTTTLPAVSDTSNTSSAPESATTSEVLTSTSTETVASTSLATSAPSGLVEVLYSFDESNWKSLGFVEHDEFDTKQFEIPADLITSWDDVSKIHLGVRSVPMLDGLAPIIYLDAAWLEVEYERVGEDPHPAPSLLRGDVFVREANYGDDVAVLVSRSLINDLQLPAFASSSATSTSGGETVALVVATTTTATIDTDRIYELWLHNNTTRSWQFIADRKQVGQDSTIFFNYGNVFWIGKDGALWKYNVASGGYDSSSMTPNKEANMEFRDESSGLKKIILDQGTTTPRIEDVVVDGQ